MIVELVDITDRAEEKIARYAAICYDAKTDQDSNARRIKKLLQLGHLATLRFASATFRISDISRVTSHQIVRHPHLSFLQRSQRYCDESESTVILPAPPAGGMTNDLMHTIYEALIAARTAYDAMRAAGYSKGDARYILPQGSSTELYATGNFQAWFDFLQRREDKSAQWEIRGVANQIRQQLHDRCPNIF